MPSPLHIKYLLLLKSAIVEPILIVGAKVYDFDSENFVKRLNAMGFNNILGIDIQPGRDVDYGVDICDKNHPFIKDNLGRFKTIISMQVFYAVKNPFSAAQNISDLLSPGGSLIFSDEFCHRINRIPTDFWRFTYDAHKLLFSSLNFDDRMARIGITRTGELIPYSYPLPEILKYKRSKDESAVGFIIRKIQRKFFAHGIFEASRFLPELTILSFAKKPSQRVLNERSCMNK